MPVQSTLQNITSNRTSMIDLIRKKWPDQHSKPDSHFERYNDIELEAYAEYGNPRAFYQQEYDYDPPFVHDSQHRLLIPEPLEKHTDSQISKQLGIRKCTRNVLRVKVAHQNTKWELNQDLCKLRNNFPATYSGITPTMRSKMEELSKYRNPETITNLVIDVAYRVAHRHGIYIERESLVDVFGIHNKSVITQELDDIILSPTIHVKRTNLREAIYNLTIRLIDSGYISHDLGMPILAYIKRLDPDCLGLRLKSVDAILTYHILKNVFQIESESVFTQISECTGVQVQYLENSILHLQETVNLRLLERSIINWSKVETLAIKLKNTFHFDTTIAKIIAVRKMYGMKFAEIARIIGLNRDNYPKLMQILKQAELEIDSHNSEILSFDTDGELSENCPSNENDIFIATSAKPEKRMLHVVSTHRIKLLNKNHLHSLQFNDTTCLALLVLCVFNFIQKYHLNTFRFWASDPPTILHT